MDWRRDNGQIAKSGRESILQFDPESRATTILLNLNGKPTERKSLLTREEWGEWQREKSPQPDGSTTGLVLIMPGRAGKQPLGNADPRAAGAGTEVKTETGELRHMGIMDFHTLNHETGSLRRLPVSAETYSKICMKFFIHSDIVRVISRADVPTFSVSEVKMGDFPAYIIQLRTTNAWGMDLAMTCTYFPHCMLTFAMVLGCTPPIETEIIKRLNLAPEDASHPLLIPGIIAELERKRHAGIVDHSVDKLESRIVEFDTMSTDRYGIHEAETARKNTEKRNDWLDMSYLRNQLVVWVRLLTAIAAWAEKSSDALFPAGLVSPLTPSPEFMEPDSDTFLAAEGGIDSKQKLKGGTRSYQDNDDRPENDDNPDESHQLKDSSPDSDQYKTPSHPEAKGSEPIKQKRGFDKTAIRDNSEPPARKPKEISPKESTIYDSDERDHAFLQGAGRPPLSKQEMDALRGHMRRIGHKFAGRFREIKDEYDDKIRDCKMRLDGMAIASQWVEGETNFQIALEMRRDSRHMRSIALVTMVFLPGTFFASVFSMTFFSWPSGSSDGKNSSAAVSQYLWIWAVFTVVATLATFAFWWYFIIFREARARKLKAKANTDEEAAPLA